MVGFIKNLVGCDTFLVECNIFLLDVILFLDGFANLAIVMAFTIHALNGNFHEKRSVK